MGMQDPLDVLCLRHQLLPTQADQDLRVRRLRLDRPDRPITLWPVLSTRCLRSLRPIHKMETIATSLSCSPWLLLSTLIRLWPEALSSWRKRRTDLSALSVYMYASSCIASLYVQHLSVEPAFKLCRNLSIARLRSDNDGFPCAEPSLHRLPAFPLQEVRRRVEPSLPNPCAILHASDCPQGAQVSDCSWLCIHCQPLPQSMGTKQLGASQRQIELAVESGGCCGHWRLLRLWAARHERLDQARRSSGCLGCGTMPC